MVQYRAKRQSASKESGERGQSMIQWGIALNTVLHDGSEAAKQWGHGTLDHKKQLGNRQKDSGAVKQWGSEAVGQ